MLFLVPFGYPTLLETLMGFDSLALLCVVWGQQVNDVRLSLFAGGGAEKI